MIIRSISVSMYKIILIVQDCMICCELVSNRKIMHAISAIVSDCIYGNENWSYKTNNT